MFENGVAVCSSFEKQCFWNASALWMAPPVDSQEDLFAEKSRCSCYVLQGPDRARTTKLFTSLNPHSKIWLLWHGMGGSARVLLQVALALHLNGGKMSRKAGRHISAASSYVHRTFWKERKGGIEWYMRGCDWGFFMTERVPLRHGHWTLADLATAE